MIEPAEQYKRTCALIDYYANRMGAAFDLFVKLSLATIGGFIWLKIQPDANKAKFALDNARWIIPILAALLTLQLLSDLWSWWGNRVREAELIKRPAIRPVFLKSGRLEYLRIAAAWLIAILSFYNLQ